MAYSACPRCASSRMKPGSIADGAFGGGGEALVTVCQDCRFRGSALYFETSAEYEEFRAERKAAGPEPAKAQPSREGPANRAGPRKTTGAVIWGIISIPFLLAGMAGALAVLVSIATLRFPPFEMFTLMGAGVFGLLAARAARRMWRGA